MHTETEMCMHSVPCQQPRMRVDEGAGVPGIGWGLSRYGSYLKERPGPKEK